MKYSKRLNTWGKNDIIPQELYRLRDNRTVKFLNIHDWIYLGCEDIKTKEKVVCQTAPENTFHQKPEDIMCLESDILGVAVVEMRMELRESNFFRDKYQTICHDLSQIILKNVMDGIHPLSEVKAGKRGEIG